MNASFDEEDASINLISQYVITMNNGILKFQRINNIVQFGLLNFISNMYLVMHS